MPLRVGSVHRTCLLLLYIVCRIVNIYISFAPGCVESSPLCCSLRTCFFTKERVWYSRVYISRISTVTLTAVCFDVPRRVASLHVSHSARNLHLPSLPALAGLRHPLATSPSEVSPDFPRRRRQRSGGWPPAWVSAAGVRRAAGVEAAARQTPKSAWGMEGRRMSYRASEKVRGKAREREKEGGREGQRKDALVSREGGACLPPQGQRERRTQR